MQDGKRVFIASALNSLNGMIRSPLPDLYQKTSTAYLMDPDLRLEGLDYLRRLSQ